MPVVKSIDVDIDWIRIQLGQWDLNPDPQESNPPPPILSAPTGRRTGAPAAQGNGQTDSLAEPTEMRNFCNNACREEFRC
jgi:hypothetical protein